MKKTRIVQAFYEREAVVQHSNDRIRGPELQSKGPEHLCSTMDVTGFPNLLVQSKLRFHFVPHRLIRAPAQPKHKHSLSPY